MATSDVILRAALEIDASIERLWPILSDTDRTNRLIGLPASEHVQREKDLSRIIKGHYLGVPVTWQEQPFEWVFQRWFAVERTFNAPIPVTRLYTRTALVPLPNQRTRVEVEVQVRPRNMIGRLGARPVIGQQMIGNLMKLYRQIGNQIVNEAIEVPPPVKAPTVNVSALERGKQLLQQAGIRDELTHLLLQHLRATDDPDVLRMRPFALADRWNVPRFDVLRMFLYATRAGLLDLEWDIMCPSCRGPSVQTTHLADLPHEAHCPTCYIRYDVDFDQAVELRFNVHKEVREAVDMTYCAGGPANTRHILSQMKLAPGEQRDVTLPLNLGTYRVRSPQIDSSVLIEVQPHGEFEGTVRFDQGGFAAPAALATGNTTVQLHNEGSEPALLIFEQTAWSAQAASAALVTSLSEFRQLFSSEVLAPGLGLSVRNMTFLFSDLKGSTAIYEQIGDAPAFARVRDHFTVMQGIIGRWRGAQVKTIGDAVMAVFPVVDDAVEAAFEIQREFTLGMINRGSPMLKVKLGLHRGACIAVNANGQLDYFGSTVNVAARVQNESIGGDLVITPEIHDDQRVQRILIREAPEIDAFYKTVKGVSQELLLYRIWPQVQQTEETTRDQETVQR
jgi:class 3 adenylate cyclase